MNIEALVNMSKDHMNDLNVAKFCDSFMDNYALSEQQEFLEGNSVFEELFDLCIRYKDSTNSDEKIGIEMQILDILKSNQ